MTWLLTALTIAALNGTAASLVPRWETRAITTLGRWPVLITVQTIAAALVAAFVAPVFGTAAAVSAAAAAWLSILAVSTDLACRKIPYEIPHPVAVIGLVAWAFDATVAGAVSFAVATLALVLIPLLVRALTRQGLGMSDVRLLWAYVATTSWWAGPTWLIYGLLLAAGIQILVRLISIPLGWGELVPANRHLDEAALAPRDLATVRTRRELPFAPAIVIATLLCLAAAVATGSGSCDVWVCG